MTRSRINARICTPSARRTRSPVTAPTSLSSSSTRCVPVDLVRQGGPKRADRRSNKRRRVGEREGEGVLVAVEDGAMEIANAGPEDGL